MVAVVVIANVVDITGVDVLTVWCYRCCVCGYGQLSCLYYYRCVCCCLCFVCVAVVVNIVGVVGTTADVVGVDDVAIIGVCVVGVIFIDVDDGCVVVMIGDVMFTVVGHCDVSVSDVVVAGVDVGVCVGVFVTVVVTVAVVGYGVVVLDAGVARLVVCVGVIAVMFGVVYVVRAVGVSSC